MNNEHILTCQTNVLQPNICFCLCLCYIKSKALGIILREYHKLELSSLLWCIGLICFKTARTQILLNRMIEHGRVKGIKEIKLSIVQTTAKIFDRKKNLFIVGELTESSIDSPVKPSLRSCGFVKKFNTALVNLCRWELLEGAYGKILVCNESSNFKSWWFNLVLTSLAPVKARSCSWNEILGEASNSRIFPYEKRPYYYHVCLSVHISVCLHTCLSIYPSVSIAEWMDWIDEFGYIKTVRRTDRWKEGTCKLL